MKSIFAFLVLISSTAFAQENEYCYGGPYWALMEKSQRICHEKSDNFGHQNGVVCQLKWHNNPNVCWSDCKDAAGKLRVRIRVDMTSDCNTGEVFFLRTKKTWY